MEYSSRLVSSDDNPLTTRYVPMSPRYGGWGVLADLFRARITKANVLLVGPDHLVENVVSLLISDLKSSSLIRRQNGELMLPAGSPRVRTAVVRDVDTLTSDEQRRLLDWLGSTPYRPQVVSTTSAPLLPLVEAGLFNDSLYYRLNTMYVDVCE
jgi:Sigma-54 interaction domain